MDPPPNDKQGSALRTILREPLLWFIVVGAALFAGYELVRADEKETITISRRMILAVVSFEEELRGRELTEQERRDLVAGLVENEILRSEAYRRGYDQTDSRVRKQLISQMRLLLTETPPEPTVAQLEVYLAENLDRFMIPPTVTLEQVVFNSMEDVGPDGGEAVLAQLRDGADPRALGVELGMERTLRRASEFELARAYGGRFARQVIAFEENVWSGPVESVRGVHFVRITERTPAAAPELEKIESFLRMDWEMDVRRGDLDRKLEIIGRQYRVIVEDVDAEEEPP